VYTAGAGGDELTDDFDYVEVPMAARGGASRS
jgi:hypothetical protein